MEIRIEDIRTPPVPRAADDGRLPEASAPGPVYWKFLCERERVRAEDAETRADAVEVRCEELRWREVRARQRASSLDAVGKSNRAKLKAAREEVREEVRRTAKRAVALEREAARLSRLLAEAGVDARKRSTVVSLRMENAALKAEVRRLRDRVAEGSSIPILRKISCASRGGQWLVISTDSKPARRAGCPSTSPRLSSTGNSDRPGLPVR